MTLSWAPHQAPPLDVITGHHKGLLNPSLKTFLPWTTQAPSNTVTGIILTLSPLHHDNVAVHGGLPQLPIQNS